MNYSTKNFLNFKGFSVQKVENTNRQITIHLTPRRKTGTCPTCENRSKSLYEKGGLREIKHSRYMGKSVCLVLPARRFFCEHCGITFNEKPVWVEENARTTTSFVSETISSLTRSSFSAISDLYSTDYHFLANKLLELDLNSMPWPEGELALGFDEHSFAKGKMVITVTELRHKQLLAILPEYTKGAVISYLNSRGQGELGRVKELCFDLRFKQKRTVQSYFPDATTVMDKFHVLAYASSLIDQDRRIICPNTGGIKFENLRRVMKIPKNRLGMRQREYLDSVLNANPVLRAEWEIYQSLVDFYSSTSKEDARVRLNEIKARASTLDKYSYLRSLSGTISRLGEEILNYFDNKTTNAYTEGVHTKIKMLKRTSFGFRNIDVYIKKMMLAFIPFVVISGLLLPR
jgi:transposase